ncbi:MAG TPA: hypothetical protein VLB44_22555 [Kofleriaceae bacterium]|nr:hypothetical protein [Kofleriaceae bacterium]
MQATFGIGGHGLLLAPSPESRVMVTEDRDLVVMRGEREVARITPGDEPARGDAVWFASGIARFGDGGPMLELAEGVELEAVFLKIDTGMAHVEWSALAGGVMVELPINVVLVPAQPGDADPYFELHAPGGRDEFISFMPRPVSADELVIHPAPYQRLVKTGKTSDEIPYTECAYEYDGKKWRQIFYAVPLPNDETVVVRAQAAEPHVELLFQAAEAAATSLVPLR